MGSLGAGRLRHSDTKARIFMSGSGRMCGEPQATIPNAWVSPRHCSWKKPQSGSDKLDGARMSTRLSIETILPVPWLTRLAAFNIAPMQQGPVILDEEPRRLLSAR